MGYRDNEFGIKATGVISVLGSLVYDTESREFRIDHPNFITLSKGELIRSFNKSIEGLQHRRNIQLLVASLTTIYVARRTFKYYQSNKLKVDGMLNRVFRR